jgi:hypothetical protein
MDDVTDTVFLQLEASGDLPQARDFTLALNANANLQPGKKTFAVDGVTLNASGKLEQGQFEGTCISPEALRARMDRSIDKRR